jgi:hypothetical protein
MNRRKAVLRVLGATLVLVGISIGWERTATSVLTREALREAPIPAAHRAGEPVRSAWSDDCLGKVTPMNNPIVLRTGDDWAKIMEEDIDCALSYRIVEGEVEFDYERGTFVENASAQILKGTVGGLPKRMRATGGTDAKIRILLCPSGKGPQDKSWQCRPFETGTSARSNRFVGIGVVY